MAVITTQQLLDLVTKSNRFFTVKFVKRSTGEVRVMNCRYGVKKHRKGGERAYDPKDYGLVCVWDRNKKDYRSFNLEGLISLTINNQTYEVQP